jgi:Tfp pilus assembly protein PilO
MKNSSSFILFLIAVGLFYTFINPQYQKVNALRLQATSYENVLANVTALTEKRDELTQKMQAIPPIEIQRLEKILPDHVDTVRLVVDIDSIAARYGISIKNIKAESTQDQGATVFQSGPATSYDKVKLSFTFNASYDNFRKFMHDVESSLRIVEVKTLAFTAVDTGLYDFQIAIETYWLK